MKKNKIFLFSAAALLAIGLVGCATDKPAETGTSTATQTETATATQTSTATATAPIVTISVNAAVKQVRAGDKVEFTVTVANSEETPKLTVDKASIGTIVKEGTRTYLKGVAAGEVTVTAAIGEVKGTCKFTVTPALTVTLSAEATSVRVGADLPLTVTVTNKAEGETISVTSSDETKATVSVTEGKYKVHGVATGTVTITLTCGSKTDTLELTVTPVPTIDVTTTQSDLMIGEELPLTLTITNTEETATVTSSDETKATVAKKDDGKFYIKGIAEGSVTFTATVDGVQDTLTLNVVKAHAIELKAKGDATEVYVGDQLELVLTITDNSRGLTPELTSSDTKKATIVKADNKYYVKGIAAGEVTLKAKLGNKESTLKINVVTLGVAITNTTTEVTFDSKLEIKVSVTHNKDNTPLEVKANETPNGELKYENEKYYLYGYKPGEVTITATVGEVTATKTFTVTNKTGFKAKSAFSSLLKNSVQPEKETLKDGILDVQVKGSTGNFTRNEKVTFEVFNDNRFDINQENRNTNKTTHMAAFVEGNNLIKVKEEISGKSIVNLDYKASDMSADLQSAKDYTGVINMSLGDTPTQTITGYYLGFVGLKEDNLPDRTYENSSLLFEKTGDYSYKYTASGITVGSKYYYAEVSATIDINASGLIKNLAYTNLKYRVKDGAKGTLFNTTTINLTLNDGARVASPADAITSEKLKLTDYTPAVISYEDAYYVGSTYTVEADSTKEIAPKNYAKKCDPVLIESVVPSSAATISEDKTQLTIKEVSESIVVNTTTANGVKKNVTIKSVEPKLPEISLSIQNEDANKLTVGDTMPHILKVDIGYDYLGESQFLLDSIKLEVVEGATAGFTMQPDPSGEGFTVSCPIEGTATIKATSPYYKDADGNPLTATLDLTFVVPDYAKDIADNLTNEFANFTFLDAPDMDAGNYVEGVGMYFEPDATDKTGHTVIAHVISGEKEGTIKVHIAFGPVEGADYDIYTITTEGAAGDVQITKFDIYKAGLGYQDKDWYELQYTVDGTAHTVYVNVFVEEIMY